MIYIYITLHLLFISLPKKGRVKILLTLNNWVTIPIAYSARTNQSEQHSTAHNQKKKEEREKKALALPQTGFS